MKHVLAVLLLYCNFSVFAQKPVLDTAAVRNWPKIDYELISNDGNYVAYYMVDPEGRPAELCLQSTKDAFRVEFVHARYDDCFTEDSRQFLFTTEGDSLCRVDLLTQKVSYMGQVLSYRVPQAGEGRWLGYVLASGQLIVEDLFAGTRTNYGEVDKFSFSDEGKVALLQRVEGKMKTLEWVDLTTGKDRAIYKGERFSEPKWAKQEDRVAFVATRDEGGQTKDVLYLYKEGMDSAEVAVNERTMGMEKGFVLGQELPEFSPDGEKVFFHLRQVLLPAVPTAIGASVDIWNYKDVFLQCDQLNNREAGHLETFKSVYNTSERKVLRLEQESDGSFGMEKLNQGNNDDYLLTASQYNVGEVFFGSTNRTNLYLISTKDGSRMAIAMRLLYPFAEFSPGGKYVFWYDHVKRAYIAYNIRLKTRRNISGTIHVSLLNDQHENTGGGYPYGSALWLAGDSAILLYDRYDIWKVDPEGIKPPVNLTNGFGRRHGIELRCTYYQGKGERKEAVINGHGELILCALNERSKSNGFFSLNLEHIGNPVELVMGRSLFYFPSLATHWSSPQSLWKAKGAEKYLLRKMSATEYPNLMVTEDFKSFTPTTTFQPQRQYNWLTSELVLWKTFSGRDGAGILYKPENFDPKRRYPILFYYYEQMSDGLNYYPFPALCNGSINIAWFVSRGYLVFCPDIHYVPGDVGAGIYDKVVSAAQMIRSKPWVDAERMGIQGHSFSGYETNYLVTRTGLFAAAASSAGASDLISMSGGAGFAGCSTQSFVEFSQFRMAVPFWKNREAYIRNSPVFQVKKIVTPLLILQNKNDGAIPWGQGVELFTALRRLGKPVWMLQYDGQGHVLDGKSALDYTIRLTQYFDHFLRGRAEPEWMSVGIPARRKGIDDGLEIANGGSR